MAKSGYISVLLMTFLFGSGNFLTMERGFVADHVNIIGQCRMPKSCNKPGFTGWYEVGSHCVKYFNRPLNFTDAEFSCKKTHSDAHLVSVHSSEHNDYLLCIVKNVNPNNLRIWLGGFELFKTGKFFWIDGSTSDYENWTCGEPNHIYTNQEECLEMNWKEIGRWNDDSCFVKKNYFCAVQKKAILEADSE